MQTTILNMDQAIVLGGLLEAAKHQPDRRIDIRDERGAIVATLISHDLPARPQDMPRALRPKQRLSRRQRTAAKHSKLEARSG